MLPHTQKNSYNSCGISPLLKASFEGFAEIVSVLLDAPNIDVNLADSEGITPLYAACMNNNLDVIKLLVRARGINLNTCTKGGWSPLYMASGKGFADIVSVLLTAHPEVHLKCDKGLTALDAAIILNHTAVIALLLAHITQTEGAEAAVKAEVGAMLRVLIMCIE